MCKWGQLIGLIPLLIALVFCPAIGVYTASADNDIKIVLADGSVIEFPDQKPFINNNRIFVPLRFVSQALSCTVAWNQSTQTVSVSNSHNTITMSIGSPTIMINGSAKSIDAPALLMNGRTMVPLRFISEGLGAGVVWDDKSNTVTITPPKTQSSYSKQMQKSIASQINNLPDYGNRMGSVHQGVNQLVGWGGINSFDQDQWEKYSTIIKPVLIADITWMLDNTSNICLQEDLRASNTCLENAYNMKDTEQLRTAHRIIHDLDSIIFNPDYTSDYWGASKTVASLLKPLNNSPFKVLGYYALGTTYNSSWTDLFATDYPKAAGGNTDIVSDLALGWYSLDKNGALITDSTSGWKRPDGWKDVLTSAGQYHLNTEMMVALTDESQIITEIINNQSMRDKVTHAIVAESKLYNGVNLDLEGLGFHDSGADLKQVQVQYTEFIRQLAGELKGNNKSLSLSLHPLNSEYRGYDYEALGKMADNIIIMAYDYGTQPEPINKVLEAVDLASILVPADKLMLGISLASEDASSIVSKVAIAQRYNLKGIAIWRLGMVPDDAWTKLREINSSK